MTAPSFRIDSRDDLLRAISIFSASPDTRHRVPLLQALYQGHIAFLEVVRTGSAGKLKTFLGMVDQPALVLLGDDDDGPTGPAGWSVAERALRWARVVLIHGTGGEVEHYQDAVAVTRLARRVVMIETNTTMTSRWVDAVRRWAPRAAVQVREVLPGGAPHPVATTLGPRH